MIARVGDQRPVVLVVEDEWLIRLDLADGLREAGRAVVEAANGAEAIAYLQSGAPVDLIVTDVRMPGPVDGLAVLTFARRWLPNLPVIVCSGHLDPALAMAAGATAFVRKPYSISALEGLVESSLAAGQ